jgi:hypothetical protein
VSAAFVAVTAHVAAAFPVAVSVVPDSVQLPDTAKVTPPVPEPPEAASDKVEL